MDRISRMLQNAGPQGGNMAAPTSDAPQVDTAEQISISSLALLKMLKHGASWLLGMLRMSPMCRMGFKNHTRLLLCVCCQNLALHENQQLLMGPLSCAVPQYSGCTQALQSSTAALDNGMCTLCR